MKDKLLTFLFIGIICIFPIVNIITPNEEISASERRKLATLPEFEFDSGYIKKVDKYLLDHFVFRDFFRGIKANYNYKLMRRLDNNGIYLKDNYIYKSNYPLNKGSVLNVENNILKLEELFTEQNKVYLMIVPDKNYYLKDSNFLQIDYDYIYKELGNLDVTGIDLRDVLELHDYYETDTHWRQEKLSKVVSRMSSMMDFDDRNIKYDENHYDLFYGVYYGESAINRKPERLTYLSNDILEKAEVSYLENKELTSIYNLDKLEGLDSYEVYLDGASSFIRVTNKESLSERRLVVFRDSFGSSLVPLLVPYYSEITVIDNRYISSNNFKDKIRFTDQDVLFMYSTLLINNSGSLKG